MTKNEPAFMNTFNKKDIFRRNAPKILIQDITIFKNLNQRIIPIILTLWQTMKTIIYTFSLHQRHSKQNYWFLLKNSHWYWGQVTFELIQHYAFSLFVCLFVVFFLNSIGFYYTVYSCIISTNFHHHF